MCLSVCMFCITKDLHTISLQVVTKAEFDFAHAPIFQNVTIAAWDPGKYNASLEDWLTTSDYDLFSNYEIYRRRYPKSRAFLVNAHSIWRLWQSLQTFAGDRPIRKNPPSSGFIGTACINNHITFSFYVFTVNFILDIYSTHI